MITNPAGASDENRVLAPLLRLFTACVKQDAANGEASITNREGECSAYRREFWFLLTCHVLPAQQLIVRYDQAHRSLLVKAIIK